MNFKVKRAEAVYTGGGIFVFCGITNQEQHFMASDDPNWVMLTNELTMTDELSNEEWNDRWYMEWQDANRIYETAESKEADAWILAIYDYLIDNNDYDLDLFKRRRADLLDKK